MKVLYVDYYLPESLYMQELAREMKNQADISIFCKENADTSETDVTWLPLLYRGGGNKVKIVLNYVKNMLTLERVIRKGHYDIVHVQNLKKLSVEIPMYRRLKSHYGKLVHTVHNVLPHEATEEDRRRYGELYRICDELIVHNEVSKMLLSGSFPVSEKKISVIPHGAYQTYDVTPRKGKREPGKTTFLMFGLIRKYKGIDLLIEAVSKLDKETRSKCHFIIAGKQWEHMDHTDYQALIDSFQLGDVIELHKGHVDDKDIPALFERADIGVFPYRNIYGSGALLMSYTFRLPVIVSDVPALIEEIGVDKTGISFRSENTAELAGAITQAANWPEETYALYQHQIGEMLETKYSWKTSAKLTAMTYERIPGQVMERELAVPSLLSFPSSNREAAF